MRCGYSSSSHDDPILHTCVFRVFFKFVSVFRAQTTSRAQVPRTCPDIMSTETCVCSLQSFERFFEDRGVLLSMRVTTVVGYIVVVLWCVLFWRIRSSPVDFLKRVLAITRRWLTRRVPRDEVQEKVLEIMSARRARRGWTLCVGIAVLVGPLFVFRLMELHLHAVWGNAQPDVLRD